MSNSGPDRGPIIVLVAGGHAAGKHTANNLLVESLHSRGIAALHPVHTIDMDNYVKPDATDSCKNKPSRFDFAKLKSDIGLLPLNSIVIVIGLYALYDKDLRDAAQVKVFIDSDPDTRLIRWIKRDIGTSSAEDDSTNTSNLETVLNLYLNGARTEMIEYIFPTKEFADVIFPRGVEQQSVSLVIDGMQDLLDIKPTHNMTKNTLRPKTFRKEKFDNEKGKFYELN